MSKYLLGLTLLLSFNFLKSQESSINRVDERGLKDGYWIIYLNKYGKRVVDTVVTRFYWRYTYFDHGKNIYPMGRFISKKGKIDGPSVIPSNNDAILLNGEYKCYEKGRLRYVHVFKNGYYVSYKEFYANGQIAVFFDYTKHAEGQPNSWYMTCYDPSGRITREQWVKKDEKGHWPKMRG